MVDAEIETKAVVAEVDKDMAKVVDEAEDEAG